MRLTGLIICFLVAGAGAWAQCSLANLSACPSPPFNAVQANTYARNASAASVTTGSVMNTLAIWFGLLTGQIVPTNAALRAWSVSIRPTGTTTYRQGFNAVGDGGAATYTLSANNCGTSGNRPQTMALRCSR
jgi:hypothetical protein